MREPGLFDLQMRMDQLLKHLYGIGQIPCDTQMRKILDPIDPTGLRPAFQDVFRQLQRGKASEEFVFHEGCYLLALDGTGYFSSTSIHCDSCLAKTSGSSIEKLRIDEVARSDNGAVYVNPHPKSKP